MKGNNIIEQLYAQNMPAPFLSLIISDCLEKGVDYNAGGARYNTNYLQGVGIGTITDSLSAIKYHVFDKKHISMDTLLSILADNYRGELKARQLLKQNTPRYGNDDDYADTIMQEVFEAFYHEVEGRSNTKGGNTVSICYRLPVISTLVQ